MTSLDLPGAFRDTWLPPEFISPWATLEALARGLMAAELQPNEDDPIWWVLTYIDGREPGQLPGFALPDAPSPLPPFRMPPSWLPWLQPDPASLHWSASAGRLQAWLPDGSLLIDIPSDDPQHDLAIELKDLNLLLPSTPPHPPIEPLNIANDLLTAWLVRTIPTLRSILQNQQITTELLHVPARLYVTSSHIDLVVRIDSASLPIRRAGLDKSPGWLRPFGRVISFHFL